MERLATPVAYLGNGNAVFACHCGVVAIHHKFIIGRQVVDSVDHQNVWPMGFEKFSTAFASAVVLSPITRRHLAFSIRPS